MATAIIYEELNFYAKMVNVCYANRSIYADLVQPYIHFSYNPYLSMY